MANFGSLICLIESSSAWSFLNDVAVGFQSNWMELNTSILQRVTAHLVSSTQLPLQNDTP